MKAIFYQGNERIEPGACSPREPGPGEAQIQVSHVGICGTDLHIFHGKMDHRVTFPQILGHEASGVIRATGPQVEAFREGDRVTVLPLDPCGECPACLHGHSYICYRQKVLGIDAPGAMQSLWTVPAHTLHRLPENLPLPVGAMIEPVAVACHDVRAGELKAGDYSVVLGGGPIGMLIALVAQAEGARVLLSEINPFRLALAKELGIEAVNPKEGELAKRVLKETDGTGADVVFEVTGSAAGAEVMTQLGRSKGRIVVVGVFGEPVKVDLFRFFWREYRLMGARLYQGEDFTRAIELAASGALPLERLITEVRPLEDLESGFRQMESGGAVMKILLDCRG